MSENIPLKINHHIWISQTKINHYIDMSGISFFNSRMHPWHDSRPARSTLQWHFFEGLWFYWCKPSTLEQVEDLWDKIGCQDSTFWFFCDFLIFWWFFFEIFKCWIWIFFGNAVVIFLSFLLVETSILLIVDYWFGWDGIQETVFQRDFLFAVIIHGF